MPEVEKQLPAAPEQKLLPPPPKKHKSLWWLWLLCAAALGYGAWSYYKTGEEKAKATAATQERKNAQRAVPIAAVAARRGDMPVYIRGLGSAAAYNTVAVKSRVDGQLLSVKFSEGQFVKKGQELAQIDPRPFQVQLEQAEGQRARDQAQWNDAKVNLARYEALWKAGVIAKQQLDTQQALVGQYSGTLEADQAAISNAKLQLTYAQITAPLSGRIGLRAVDVGNMVHAADPNGIATISQLEPIAVLFTIPADNLPSVLSKLRAGVKLRVDAYDRDDKNKIATGHLLTLDNQIDPTTGTSKLKAEFDNADNSLFPNQFVNCRLLIDTQHGVVIIPSSAVQRGPQGTYVYVVGPDGAAHLRVITTGTAEGNDVSIASGLNAGDMVVVDGQDKLTEGSKVEMRTPGGGGGRGGPGGPGGGGRRGGQGGGGKRGA